MKRVEMHGDQRDLIAILIDKADSGHAVVIPVGLRGTLKGLLDAYDAAEYETGGVKKTTADYKRGYEEGYEQGDKDCLASWVRSTQQGGRR